MCLRLKPWGAILLGGCRSCGRGYCCGSPSLSLSAEQLCPRWMASNDMWRTDPPLLHGLAPTTCGMPTSIHFHFFLLLFSNGRPTFVRSTDAAGGDSA